MLFRPYIGTKVPLMRTWLSGIVDAAFDGRADGRPLTTPSRMVSWPFCRVNSARNRDELATLLLRRVLPASGNARPSCASPLTVEVADIDQAFLGAGSSDDGGSIASASWPPTILE